MLADDLFRVVAALSEAAASDLIGQGLRPANVAVLELLARGRGRRHDDAPRALLEEALGTTRQAVQKHLQQLFELGLVGPPQRRDQGMRPTLLPPVTPRGMGLVHRVMRRRELLIARVLSPLAPSELAAFSGLIGRVAASLCDAEGRLTPKASRKRPAAQKPTKTAPKERK